MKPKYRFTPSLFAKFDEFVNAEALYDKLYGDKEEPAVTLAEFEEKCELELWDAINRVPHVPTEAASRGTLLNAIIDCKVEWRKPDPVYKIERVNGPDGKTIGIRGECDGFPFVFDAGLIRELGAYFSGCICQYRTEAVLDTACGPVILYGDVDYIRRDKVFDLKSTAKYAKYGKFDNGWQKYVYPYCLIESGELDSVSEFEYTIVLLRQPKGMPVSGTIYKEVEDYSHDMAKTRLRGISESLVAYLEANADKIVHPSRVLNEI